MLLPLVTCANLKSTPLGEVARAKHNTFYMLSKLGIMANLVLIFLVSNSRTSQHAAPRFKNKLASLKQFVIPQVYAHCLWY